MTQNLQFDPKKKNPNLKFDQNNPNNLCRICNGTQNNPNLKFDPKNPNMKFDPK